jgi:hypothetical protein
VREDLRHGFRFQHCFVLLSAAAARRDLFRNFFVLLLKKGTAF